MKEEGTYYPARDREGLTVFMMGSIMLEYNRKPLQIPGGPREGTAAGSYIALFG